MKGKPELLAGGMQDGMLAYYLSQARMADANVEARIEREPFDYHDYLAGNLDPKSPEAVALWIGLMRRIMS